MSRLSAPVSVTHPAWPRLPEPHSRRGHGSLCLLPMPCEVRGEWPPGSQTGRPGTVFPRVGQVFVRGAWPSPGHPPLGSFSEQSSNHTLGGRTPPVARNIVRGSPENRSWFPCTDVAVARPMQSLPGRHERGSPRPAGSIGYGRGTAPPSLGHIGLGLVLIVGL